MSQHRTVGFIGLGTMGEPMAGHLLRGGFEVVVHNRSALAVDRLISLGATSGGTPAAVAAVSDVVITMLPADAEVRAVIAGPDGILSRARPGTTIIDMSTVAPSTSRSLAAQAASRGLDLLDAPVSGGEVGAVEGTLSVMIGGDAAVLERVTPILSLMSGSITHCGPTGSGQVVKAANQLIVAANLAALAEAISLVELSGIDPQVAVSALSGGLAGSRVLETKSAKMISRSYEPGFRLDLHAKDLRIAGQTAVELGAAVPVLALVTQLVQIARSHGLGAQDHSALAAVSRGLSGQGPL